MNKAYSRIRRSHRGEPISKLHVMKTERSPCPSPSNSSLVKVATPSFERLIAQVVEVIVKRKWTVDRWVFTRLVVMVGDTTYERTCEYCNPKWDICDGRHAPFPFPESGRYDIVARAVPVVKVNVNIWLFLREMRYLWRSPRTVWNLWRSPRDASVAKMLW